MSKTFEIPLPPLRFVLRNGAKNTRKQLLLLLLHDSKEIMSKRQQDEVEGSQGGVRRVRARGLTGSIRRRDGHTSEPETLTDEVEGSHVVPLISIPVLGTQDSNTSTLPPPSQDEMTSTHQMFSEYGWGLERTENQLAPDFSIIMQSQTLEAPSPIFLPSPEEHIYSHGDDSFADTLDTFFHVPDQHVQVQDIGLEDIDFERTDMGGDTEVVDSNRQERPEVTDTERQEAREQVDDVAIEAEVHDVAIEAEVHDVPIDVDPYLGGVGSCRGGARGGGRPRGARSAPTNTGRIPGPWLIKGNPGGGPEDVSVLYGFGEHCAKSIWSNSGSHDVLVFHTRDKANAATTLLDFLTGDGAWLPIIQTSVGSRIYQASC